MKKTFRIVSMLLVVAMLVTALSVYASAAELFPNQEKYAGLGQSVYMTGDNDYSVSNQRKISLDGVIHPKEAWVEVTPEEGVAHTRVNKAISYSTNSAGDTIKVTKTDAAAETFNQIKTHYYVAQDDEYVYVAVKQVVPTAEYSNPMKMNFSLGAQKNIMSHLRLGFNSADYTQQLAFYSHGQFITQDSSVTVGNVTFETKWYRYPFLIKSISNNSTVTELALDCGIFTDPLTDTYQGCTTDEKSGTCTRSYEMKLSKAGIKAQYEAAFGADAAANIDFKTMFIGGTYSDYVWANSNSNYWLYWANGTVIGTADASKNGVNKLLPDVIYFGKEVEETEPVTTEAPATEDTAIESDNVAEDPAQAGGCGGMISVAGIALVAALGTCTAFVAKKKED